MQKSHQMEKLSKEITNCKQCELWKTRTHPVIGEGSLNAKLFFIGEAPGFNEDKQGRPFVGRAGKILDDLIESVGLKREEVYIANILKCRPPNNRNPFASEIQACSAFLKTQLQLIDPSIIIPMGSFATEYVFNTFNLPFTKISELHGKMYSTKTLYNTKTILPMYHPAVATYNPNNKTILLTDIKKVEPFIVSKTIW
ncbi:MAG: uracil-DNA glycosylase [Candidatus Thermoplasmatota archaeon]|nr:uracil-DNA glycosylase [Candidatus Thermoplasmatota archaeon]